MQLNDKLLTEQQVAEMLGVTTSGVRRWRERGLIGFIKVGKVIRFEEAEVQAFLQRHRKATV